MDMLFWEIIYRDWFTANQENKELAQADKESHSNSLGIYTVGGI